jgi:hypothetical protein
VRGIAPLVLRLAAVLAGVGWLAGTGCSGMTPRPGVGRGGTRVAVGRGGTLVGVGGAGAGTGVLVGSGVGVGDGIARPAPVIAAAL